jgi:hypothetical protein
MFPTFALECSTPHSTPPAILARFLVISLRSFHPCLFVSSSWYATQDYSSTDMHPRLVLSQLHALADAVVPFMSEQTGLHHFEFLGLDIVADESDTAWLIEGTRCLLAAACRRNRMSFSQPTSGPCKLKTE